VEPVRSRGLGEALELGGAEVVSGERRQLHVGLAQRSRSAAERARAGQAGRTTSLFGTTLLVGRRDQRERANRVLAIARTSDPGHGAVPPLRETQTDGAVHTSEDVFAIVVLGEVADARRVRLHRGRERVRLERALVQVLVVAVVTSESGP